MPVFQWKRWVSGSSYKGGLAANCDWSYGINKTKINICPSDDNKFDIHGSGCQYMPTELFFCQNFYLCINKNWENEC